MPRHLHRKRSSYPRTRPAVIAHRGGTESSAEHTLAAYADAIEAGADGVECDVRLTRDGVPVCVHDRRVNRTSDGRGVVSTLELARLDELDFAATHRGRRAADTADRTRSGVLTLERLLELVESAPRRVDLAIETKHPTRYAGLVEHQVVTLLQRYGLHRPRPGRGTVRIMSFSPVGLRRVSALLPELETVRLFGVLTPPQGLVLPPGRQIAGPSIRLLRRHPGYVGRAHAHSRPVHVWTVDTERDVRLCLELGVQAIITNRPAYVRGLVDGGPAGPAGRSPG